MVLRILAIVPARGGSKAIPRKNIKLFAGKPLLSWTIEAALTVSQITRVIVSTEDEEIAGVAREAGADVPFMRPAELSQDDTPGIAPVLHAIGCLPDYDWLLLLQPTSPLRNSKDIEGIISYGVDRDASSVASVREVSDHPYWSYLLEADASLRPVCTNEGQVFRRQDLPKVYSLNGALYFAKSNWLLGNKALVNSETLGYVMPENRSVDVDTYFDWYLAEHLMRTQREK